jgi:hypothetical protein
MCDPAVVSHRSPHGVCALGAGVSWREVEAVRVFMGGGSGRAQPAYGNAEYALTGMVSHAGYAAQAIMAARHAALPLS